MTSTEPNRGGLLHNFFQGVRYLTSAVPDAVANVATSGVAAGGAAYALKQEMLKSGGRAALRNPAGIALAGVLAASSYTFMQAVAKPEFEQSVNNINFPKFSRLDGESQQVKDFLMT
jgi:hypothetical protein